MCKNRVRVFAIQNSSIVPASALNDMVWPGPDLVGMPGLTRSQQVVDCILTRFQVDYGGFKNPDFWNAKNMIFMKIKMSKFRRFLNWNVTSRFRQFAIIEFVVFVMISMSSRYRHMSNLDDMSIGNRLYIITE